ncbi:MAG TPA: DinB family protein [Gemmatimonadaceae bacterium]|nr:DinB family protein [Gemmatimonadaceae bacterium]
MNFDLSLGRQVLERTPATLSAMLGGLSTSWTTSADGPDTWSPHLVIAHLINGERTDWIPRTRVFLERDPARTFAPFEMEGFFAEARGMPLGDLLSLFATLRADNLKTLDNLNLGPAELALTARHPELGPVTLRQHLATWVAHDLGHIVQVSRTMARQYREEVGPWRQYLSALR